MASNLHAALPPGNPKLLDQENWKGSGTEAAPTLTLRLWDSSLDSLFKSVHPRTGSELPNDIKQGGTVPEVAIANIV
jgi:hypothetical protein